MENPAFSTPIPHDLPLPLPAPEWLLVLLLVLSFMVHLLFVNFMVGGSLLTIFFEWKGRKQKAFDDIAHEIAKTITVNKSLAVVMGVAPLLLINVLYTVYFYSANALTGLAWILIVPLITVAFLLTYLHKYSWDSLQNHKGLHLFIGGVATAIFLCIPLVFLVNINLMLFPNLWNEVHGFFSALMIPNVFPRYFHFLAASITAACLFLVGYMKRSQYPYESLIRGLPRAELLKILYSGALGATGLQFLIGPLVYLTLPSHGISISMSLVILAGVFLAVPAMIYLWREVSEPKATVGRHFNKIVFLLTLTVVFMVSGRHMYRATSLEGHKKLVKAKTETYAKAVAEATEAAKTNAANPIASDAPDGKVLFSSYCGACHGYDKRQVGPPVLEIQGIYNGNIDGIVQWAKAPGKKRADYPQMPPMPLPDEQLRAIGGYMLEMKN